MPHLDHSRFLRCDELSRALHDFAAEHPQLASLASIGRSREGREIWVLTLTNTATGPASDKPAQWVDGNIHSVELSASAACLFFIEWLLAGYGRDPEITRALDTRALYVCPRVNPDGAEWALADSPKFVRSATRRYPYDEDAPEGLLACDMDGDGPDAVRRPGGDVPRLA
jgi:murein tripeptide amidase MpaA